MKLTKQQLKQLIKEELRNVLREQSKDWNYDWKEGGTKPNPASQSLEDRIKKLEICLQKQCPPAAEAPAPPQDPGVLKIQSF